MKTNCIINGEELIAMVETKLDKVKLNINL